MISFPWEKHVCCVVLCCAVLFAARTNRDLRSNDQRPTDQNDRAGGLEDVEQENAYASLQTTDSAAMIRSEHGMG